MSSKFALGLAALFFATAAAASAQPDLRPIPPRIAHGVVSVQNQGDVASTPTLVTINCHVVGQRGGCPESRGMAAFTNPAYPNRLVINVPAIQPHHVYNFTLPFFAGLAFPMGNYQFDYVVDPANVVAESNEANNTGSFVFAVP